MTASHDKWRLVFGNIVNPISDSECEFYPKGAMLLEADEDGNYQILRLGSEDSDWVRNYRLRQETGCLNFRGQLITPSFFDIHFHWVQDDVRLKPKDSLMEWLSKYAWPCEEQFADPHVCETKAHQFFHSLPKFGTLGGAVYSSLHKEALEAAFRHAQGDFVIGNVLMTMNSPEGLSQTREEATALLEDFCARYQNRYAVTPRFAPTTHPEIMQKGVALAHQHNCFIQTHLSENRSEIDYVLSLYRKFPEFKNIEDYTQIYHQVGLLGEKTILGHAIHLSNKEWRLLGETKTAVAHCPTSNAPMREKGLGSGLFDFQSADRFGVRWALASDIGGGPYISMWDVIRCFVSHQRRAHRKVSYTQALFRSTLAGASILNLAERGGNFQVGKWANFMVMDWPSSLKGEINDVELVLEKLVKSKCSRDDWDEGELGTVYKGKIVYEKSRQKN